MKRVDVVVGPNGAGKSTFVAVTLAPLLPGCAFVNADEIARQRWPADAAAHSYDAARIAAKTRATLIEMGRPFIAETVFSHPSKLDLIHEAHAAGYTVVVHALLIPEDLAVQRVRHRVLAGGHHVPEEKIRQRHHRLWPLVADAVSCADIATAYDNSRHRGPRIVARFNSGVALGSPTWPEWTPPPLPQRWPH
ncbi:zeta toxin family protein [Mycobacterium sp. 21AC1]|uniref:zeta toxin family protein n=1 Tax=[Mycobacterium] appelbergii TaxID=2939269 RepID=UPI002938DAA1|nr:zeta toxin family protein [Mycobacterium sp. 21AC1]MDV3126321.1 zeta toxin family protein [Mycobacterium sp. 21AC1]